MRQVAVFGTTTATTVSANDAMSIPADAMCAADKNRGLEVHSLSSTSSSFELTTSASALEAEQQQPQRVTSTRSAAFLKCDHMWVDHPWFVVFLALLTWYCSSLGITALNKYLFDTLQFNYPLLVTFVHFTSVAAFLYIVRFAQTVCVCVCAAKYLHCAAGMFYRASFSAQSSPETPPLARFLPPYPGGTLSQVWYLLQTRYNGTAVWVLQRF